MPTLPYAVVDAFTKVAFCGNPAGVFILDKKDSLDDSTLQLIARELNLAETSFVWPLAEAGHFGLRWFTPTTESPLCGHATLAAAHVLFSKMSHIDRINFQNPIAGTLLCSRVTRDEHASTKETLLELDFPIDTVWRPLESDQHERVKDVLIKAAPALRSATFVDFVRTRRGILVQVQLPPNRTLQQLEVDPFALELDGFSHILTCRAPNGDHHDFHSRVFAAKMGIPEDHVTGSAHVTLAPYWHSQPGNAHKASSVEPLEAFQASKRGGDLSLIIENDRVLIRGYAVSVSHATMQF